MGQRRVDVWVSLVVHGRVREAAAAAGVSMGDWVADVVRERLEVGDGSGVGEGVGVPVGVSGGGFVFAGGGGGADFVGVGAAVGGDAGLTGAERLATIVAARPTQDTVTVDPLEEIA